MKKIFKPILLLFLLLLISSCEVTNPNEITPPTNLEIINTTLTWDFVSGVTYYEVKIVTDNGNEFIDETTSTFEFSSYINEDVKNLTLSVKSLAKGTTHANDSEYSNEVVYINPNHPDNFDTAIGVPSNLSIEGTILSWNLAKDVLYYEVKIIINNNEIKVEAINNFDFSSYVSDNIKTISLSVKSLAKETSFKEDSAYSDEIVYTNPNYRENFEKEILNQSFISASSAPSGWKYNYAATLYKDNTLRFDTNYQSITSPSFKAYTNFKVEAKIIGKNAGGDAVITFYGLNDDNKVVEKIEVTGPIQNSTHTISATFSNTSITKIKFEYTTKATGNFGLSNIQVYHLEDRELLAIKAINTTTNYVIGDEFDYMGSLILTYPNNITEEVLISDVKKDVKITNFVNNKFFKGNLTITYLGKSTTIPYITSYDYPSLVTSNNLVEISILDQIVLLEINDLDIVFDLSNNLNEEVCKLYLEDNLLEYYFGNDTEFDIDNTLSFSLNDDTNQIFHLTPTTTLTYTSDGILIDSFGTSILINTNNVIDDNILDNYDYIISTSATYLANTKNLIINNDTTINDYDNLANIYMTNPNTSIYDTTINEEITLTIDKYSSVFTNSVTEISSLPTWSYEYSHIDFTYIYQHEDYYQSIKDLSGTSLRTALKTLITSTHINLTDYDYARDAYAITDPDLDSPGNIILFYSGDSISSKWDNGITWNREHIWPKSLSGGLFTSVSGSDRNAGTDLHHIRPASSSINSSRKNKPYGNVTDNTYFAPRDEVKGDVARILFYMSIRYDLDIEALGVAKSVDMLIEWHNQDSVDYYEEYRNEQIQNIQGNYNPFIDNPWLVDLIF